jgi:hypothetical protein
MLPVPSHERKAMMCQVIHTLSTAFLLGGGFTGVWGRWRIVNSIRQGMTSAFPYVHLYFN